MAESFLNIKITSKSKVLSVDGNKIHLSKAFEKKMGDKNILKKDRRAIAILLQEKIESNILKGVDFTGKKLPKLRESTIEGKGHSAPLLNSGKLAESIIVKTKGEKEIVTIKSGKYKNGATVPEVARWLQEGTKRHWVRPQKGEFLKWTTAGGKTYFSRGHIVSGIRPMRFFGYTQKDLKKYVKQVITDRIFKK